MLCYTPSVKFKTAGNVLNILNLKLWSRLLFSVAYQYRHCTSLVFPCISPPIEFFDVARRSW